MSYQRDDELVQQYLAGELSASERQEFRDRLKTDSQLKQMLESYSLLITDLRDLDHQEVPQDLWSRKIRPALAEAKGKDVTFWDRLAEYFHGFFPKALRPALLAGAFVLVVALVTVFLQQQYFETGNEPYAKALERIEQLRAQFQTELDILMEQMDSRKKRMSPEILQVYEQTMAKVDQAIEQAERLYSIYSDDEDAIGQLMAAYENKAKLLNQFLTMEM